MIRIIAVVFVVVWAFLAGLWILTEHSMSCPAGQHGVQFIPGAYECKK